MLKIHQNRELDLIETKKTVEWLVENTTVSVFDPVNFTGYQRKINEDHCQKIVEFLKRDFFMPTAIICATDGDFREEDPMRIVDGQHRVQAFRLMKEKVPERYEEIRNYEVPVIVMARVDENTEIDTFITINKTSKKVDTSLALVLKNRINKYTTGDDLTMPKAEYIAVELAQRLNEKKDSEIWHDKILFEGNPKHTSQLISLNAFVRSTRVLVNHMDRGGLISLEWNSKEDIEDCTEKCCHMVCAIWEIVRQTWSGLFYADLEKRRIIQGSIGYTSINRTICAMLNQNHYDSIDQFIVDFAYAMKTIPIDAEKWLPGNVYSTYSSESGYRIVSRELQKAMGL